jgi:hypothetical protein
MAERDLQPNRPATKGFPTWAREETVPAYTGKKPPKGLEARSVRGGEEGAQFSTRRTLLASSIRYPRGQEGSLTKPRV